MSNKLKQEYKEFETSEFQKNLVNHICFFEVIVVAWLIVLTSLIL